MLLLGADHAECLLHQVSLEDLRLQLSHLCLQRADQLPCPVEVTLVLGIVLAVTFLLFALRRRVFLGWRRSALAAWVREMPLPRLLLVLCPYGRSCRLFLRPSLFYRCDRPRNEHRGLLHSGCFDRRKILLELSR